MLINYYQSRSGSTLVISNLCHKTYYMAGLNLILKIFTKRQGFFQLFESVVDVLVKMGEKLKEVVNEPDLTKRAKLIKEIEDMEHVNDDYTHQIFTELGKNLLHPLTGKIFITWLRH